MIRFSRGIYPDETTACPSCLNGSIHIQYDISTDRQCCYTDFCHNVAYSWSHQEEAMACKLRHSMHAWNLKTFLQIVGQLVVSTAWKHQTQSFQALPFAGYIKVYAAGQLGLQHVCPQGNIIQKADKWSVISTSARHMRPETQVSLLELLWTEILPVYFKGFPS